MRGFILVLAAWTTLLAPSAATAAGFGQIGIFFDSWENLHTSARLSALGGSDLTDRGPAASLVNPAPFGVGNSVGISYDHAAFHGGSEFHTYAGAVEHSGVRLNFALEDFVVDSQPVRTAYNPEGTGETFDVREQMRAIGLSFDLGRAISRRSPVFWSVGFTWRKYSGFFQEAEGEGSTLDLGTTLGLVTRYENGWTGLTGVVSRQNVTDAEYTIESRRGRLPQPHRLGLTIETALGQGDPSADLVKLMIAFARVAYPDGAYRPDTDHFGLELLFLDRLAVRYGHSDRVFGGITSWGVGVKADGRWLGPLVVEADWGEMSYDNDVLTGEKAVWGVRARYDF